MDTPLLHHFGRFAWLFAIWLSFATHPAMAGDPTRTYHTIKTEHFNIHYHQGLEMMARQLANIAEETHKIVTSELGWTTRGRTIVQLVDNQDSANGMASAHIRPQILLYAAPPRLRSALQYHDHWLATVFIHEYTHVVHLQMQYGVARVINTLFGDVYLPNSMVPKWFIEGLAVLLETRHSTSGRIRSSLFQMIIRANALGGRRPPLGNISNATLTYPHGNSPYVYGSMFLDYLTRRFGQDAIFRICRRYAKKPVPYFLSTTFKQVTGHRLPELYRAWLTHNEQQARDFINGHGRQFTRANRLTTNGETKGQPRFSPDGTLFVPLADTERRGGIYRVDGNHFDPQVIAGGEAEMAFDADKNLYYTRGAPLDDTYNYTDLFLKKSNQSHPIRLTTGLRVRGFSLSPLGNQLAVVTLRGSHTALQLINVDGTVKKTLLGPKPNRQVYAPRFSPDGQTIAVVVRQGTRVDLATLPASGGPLRMITDDDAIEQSPAFSPDGRWLLYAADPDGVINIYGFNLQTLEIRQITDVATGARDPAVSPDGTQLVFNQYGVNGWDLYTMPFNMDAAPLVSRKKNGHHDFTLDANPKAPAPSINDHLLARPYNPLPSLLPQSWVLSVAKQPDGALITARIQVSDAMNQHQLTTDFNYQSASRSPGFAVTYNYRGMRPTFQLQGTKRLNRMTDGYLVDGVKKSWTRETITGEAALSTPLVGIDERHILSVGYAIRLARSTKKQSITIDPDGPLPQLPIDYFRCGLRLGWSFNDTYRSPFAVSSESGRSLFVNTTFYHPALGGNQELAALSFGWKAFMALPFDHHVLATNFWGGAYLSHPGGQASYQAGGYADQNPFDAIWNESGLGLPLIRGYAPNSLKGDHYLAARLEYRLPLFRPQVAYNTVPVYLQQLHAGFFTDQLFIGFNPFERNDLYSAIGAELVLNLFLGYHLPVTLRTGVARGLSPGGGTEFIMVVGNTY